MRGASRAATRRNADLAALIVAGRGDVPLVQMKWRCGNSGSRLTKFIVGRIPHAAAMIGSRWVRQKAAVARRARPIAHGKRTYRGQKIAAIVA